MSDLTPVTKEDCAASRAGCAQYRTLENQNLILNLREIVRAEIDKKILDLRESIEEKFDRVLKDMGYVEIHPADTAVPASHSAHPARREEDLSIKEKIVDWFRINLVWVMAVFLAGFAGDMVSPWFRRVIEALVTGFERMMK